ncbi:hypothetical protein DFJ73DRAFT_142722 [Zopfochytrium polystomum]|nr:hypothetical protein DFJ73DRAFT_142722 [Zopfochytrium polystomum]
MPDHRLLLTVAIVLSALLETITAASVSVLTVFNTSSCNAPSARAVFTTSVTSCTMSNSCAANAIARNTFTSVACSSNLSASVAAMVLKYSTSFVGMIVYSDNSCTTELRGIFLAADGGCVCPSPGLSYRGNITDGKGRFYSFSDSSCTVLSGSYGPFSASSCGGSSGNLGYVVVTAPSTNILSPAWKAMLSTWQWVIPLACVAVIALS